MNRLLTILSVLSLLICFFTVNGYAQTSTLNGFVSDDNLNPLQGATVQFQGTSIGTATNADGEYIIENAPLGEQTLIVSFIGYTTVRHQIFIERGDDIEIDFVLTEDLLGMEELVVSGTFNPATKLESSTAITTISPELINNRVPRGTADLLNAVPGMQVTSTYGEAGADVTVRGLPRTANSSFRYISLQEDGLRALEPPGMLFAFPDAYVRQDETVARVEVIRGGSAPVFTSNTPGGIVNFISKTGGPELSGIVKSSVGVHGMARQDFNLGGPFAENWRFNIGGYYRHDEGVRDPGYPANRGGQLKLNMTRFFNSGYVRFYGKYINEKNVWYMGTPFQNYKDPEPIPGGPEFGSGTSYSSDRRVLTIPDAADPGSFTQKQMDNGSLVRYKSFGVELLNSLGNGWNLALRSRLLSTDNTFNLMIDVADPFPIQGFAQGIPSSVPRFVRFANSGETITTPSEVNNLNGNGLMTVHGMGFSDQQITNFITDLQVTKQFENHSLNAGVYFSTYQIKWGLTQAGVFMEVANQPRLLQVLVPSQDGGLIGLTSHDGFAAYNSNYINVRSYTDIAAFYLGDYWEINDRLNVESGIRFDVNYSDGSNERPVVPGSVEDGMVVGQEVPAGYPSFIPTPAQTNAGMFGSGKFRNWDFTFTNIGGSVGLNYTVTDQLAIYARASQGSRTPTIREWALRTTNGSQVTGKTRQGEVEKITQLEAGVKAQRQKWSLLLTGFYSKSVDLLSTLLRGQPDGSFQFLPISADTRTIGAEFEAIARPLKGLELRLSTVIQDPRFTKFSYSFFVPGNNTYSGNQTRDYSGNRLNDIASVLADFSTSYTFKRFNIFGNYRYTGERMANRPNTITLSPYGELMMGVGLHFEKFKIGINGSNLLNTQAINIMASRTGEDILKVNDDGTAEVLVTSGDNAGTTTNSFYTTGQGIMPRSIIIRASYSF